MKRTTIFLPDDLARQLLETAIRMKRRQAEIVRDALSAYLDGHAAPFPKSVGMGTGLHPEVNSENVKEWVRQTWGRERDEQQRRESC